MEDAIPQGHPSGARHGHEADTIEVRGLIVFTVALIAVVALVHLVLWLAIQQAARKEEQLDSLYPGRLAIEVDQFPNPRLQQNPRSDLAQMKDEEERRIHSYGWMDRKAGIARIPVERAMEILAEKGLPRVPAPAPVPGAPPNTFIPPARKREEPGQGTHRAPAAQHAEPRPEPKPGAKP